MSQKFFSLVDKDALNLWLNIVASGKDTWTLDEAIEVFGDELKIFLPRLLSSNLLSGNYSKFTVPSTTEFAQLVLEETYMNFSKQYESEGTSTRKAVTQNFLIEMQKIVDSYEKLRVSNFGNMRKSLEQTVKDTSDELSSIFSSELIGEHSIDEIPQINPLEIVDALQAMKNRNHQLLSELEAEMQTMMGKYVEQVIQLYKDALDDEALGVTKDGLPEEMVQGFFDILEKKFAGFKRRSVASMEMFKLEASKLSKTQIQFINSLDEIIEKILQDSVQALGERATKILDHIFISLRQKLDTLTGNVAKKIQETENKSKEGVANLVSSVFTINRKVIDELVSALDILLQSTRKMKSQLEKNLTKIQSSIKEQVQASVDQLEASVADIKEIQEITTAKVNRASTNLEEINKELLLSVESLIQRKLEDIKEDFIAQVDSLKEVYETPHKETDIVFGELLQRIVSTSSGANDILREQLLTFLDNLDTNYVIVPRNKVAAHTPEASSFVNRNIVTARDIAQQVGIVENTQSTLKEYVTTASTEVNKAMIDLRERQISQANSAMKALDESLDKIKRELERIIESFRSSFVERIEEVTQNSAQFRSEIARDLETGFTFIYDAIDPINMRLKHFQEVETPEFFEISSEKVIGVTEILASLIEKIIKQSSKNRDRLEDQIQITQMILNNEIEALKLRVMTEMASSLTDNKNEILKTIENYRVDVSKDVRDAQTEINTIVQEKLDQPVQEFGFLISKIDDAMISLQTITEQEINTLRNEIIAMTRRIQAQVESISEKIRKSLESSTSKAVNELTATRINNTNQLRDFIVEVNSGQDLQISELANLLSTRIKEQILIIEKINAVLGGDTSTLMKKVMKEVKRKLEIMYLEVLALLNELQARTSYSEIYKELSTRVKEMMEKLSQDKPIDFEDLRTLIEGLAIINNRKSIVL